MHSRLTKFTTSGIYFENHLRALKRREQWEQFLSNPDSLPPAPSTHSDCLKIDMQLNLLVSSYISQLLQHPHKDIVNPSPVVRRVIQEFKVSPRISVAILDVFRGLLDGTGGLAAAHRDIVSSGVITDPYYLYFYARASEALDADSFHPGSEMGNAVAAYRATVKRNAAVKTTAAIGAFVKKPTPKTASAVIDR